MPDSPDPNLDPDSATIPLSGPRPTLSGSNVDLPLPEELAKLLPAGAYQVTDFLGAGGMGAVYKGTQIRLKRPVAIKIMRRDVGKDHDFEARFEREAQAMAKLNHPNIISVIDFGEAGPDYLFIVMELVDGTDLMDVIRSKQMTQEMALGLLPQICDALQFAHDHGIVHRDIKPSNIMLTRDGRVKMADFGLAKHFDHAETGFRTQTGTGMGTPDYAAPEQFDPTTSVDHRADIYALGVMIYQMITGALPRGVWRPPSQRAPVSTHWDAVVSRAMQNDPAERYQKASEVKTELSSIPLANRSTDIPVRDQTRPPQSVASKDADKNVRATSKSRAPLLVGAIGGAAVIAVSTFFVFKKPDQGSSAVPASAENPAAAAPASTTIAEADVLPAVAWKALDLSKVPNLRAENGAYTATALTRADSGLPAAVRDLVVRVRVRSAAEPRACEVWLRTSPDELRYQGMLPDKNGAQGGIHFYTRDQAALNRKLASADIPPVAWDGRTDHEIEFRASGTTLTLSLDGKPIATHTDSQLTAGKFAVVLHAGTVIRGIDYAILDDGKAPPAASAPAIDSVHTFAGHRYQFVPGDFRWEEAKAKAESMGGHLVTITSKAENEWIYATFGSKLNKDARSSSVWTGGSAESSGQPYRWVTGEPFSFTDWRKGEPDYSGTTGQTIAGPFAVVIKRHGALLWFDDPVKRKNSSDGFLVEWDGAEGAAVASTKTLNLLPLVDLKRDVVTGDWAAKPEGVSLTSSAFGVLELPYEPPEEYDFEAEFTPHGGNRNVNLYLSAGGSSFAWKLHAHGKEPPAYGLDMLDGTPIPARLAAGDGVASNPLRIEDGKRYTTRVEVRRGGLRCLVDGAEILKWSGDFKRLSMEPQTKLRNARAIGIGGYNRAVTYHRVEVREVSGAGKLTVSTGAAPEEKWQDLLAAGGWSAPWSIENGVLTRPTKTMAQRKWEVGVRDCAWRVTRRWDGGWYDLQLGLRSRGNTGVRLEFLELPQPDVIQARITSNKQKLAEGRTTRRHQKGDIITIEFRAVGTRITASINGEEVARAEETTTNGAYDIWTNYGDAPAFHKAEFLNLDGAAS